MNLSELLSNTLVQGAITGFVSAALIDYQAFRSWKNAHDAMTYDWATAAFRWLQGTIGGLITASGIAGLT